MYKTEKEILISNSIFAYKMREVLYSNRAIFSEIVEYLPCFVHFNRRDNLFWIWGNKSSIELFGFNEQPVYSDILKVSDIKVVNDYSKQIRKFNSFNDVWSSCRFLQYMETLKGWEWIHTSKLIVNDNEFVNFSYLINRRGIIDLNVKNTLNLGLGNEVYWIKLSRLTKQEKKILILLCMGDNNNTISEKLSISKHTVRKHREYIYRKLECNNIRDLLNYNKIMNLRNYF